MQNIRMRFPLLWLLAGGLVLCTAGDADAQERAAVPPPAIQVQKGPKGEHITMTGRIISRHVRFRKGKSVRAYSLVTSDGRKVALPRSHRVHRDGSISGIDLKTMKGVNVIVVCQGRVKFEGEKVLAVSVKKILSINRVLPPKPPSLAERFNL